MAAYGAELISVPAGKMELARDLAQELQVCSSSYGSDISVLFLQKNAKAAIHTAHGRWQARGVGVVLDQFGNQDNPLGHFKGTGPEVWEQTSGRITHFISSMGTTGALLLLTLTKVI